MRSNGQAFKPVTKHYASRKSFELNRLIILVSCLPDLVLLTAFAFVDRDNLQVFAGRFQHQRFVGLAGYSSVAIAQFESQRKYHPRPIVTLHFDINLS